jgi:hypothetical protein
MSQALPAMLLMLLPLPGCIQVCPNIITSAFIVTITSAATEADVCNATVTASTGAKTIALKLFEDSLMPGRCSYQDEPGLSPEGNYLISATAPGFQPTMLDTTIRTDGCGADIQQNLTVVMKSAP